MNVITIKRNEITIDRSVVYSDLTPGAVRMLLVLKDMKAHDKKISQKILSEIFGYQMVSISKWVRELKKSGLLQVKRGYHSAEYILTDEE